MSDANALELPHEIEELNEIVEEELDDDEEEEEEEEEETIDPAVLAKYCGKCKGLCCKYYTILIDDPEDASDYDELRWFLAHKDCYIYVDEEQWHVNVISNCRFLGKGGRCEIYNHRPDVCKDFGQADECEYTGELDFTHTFRTLRDLEKYAKKNLSAKEYAKLPVFPRGWKGPV